MSKFPEYLEDELNYVDKVILAASRDEIVDLSGLLDSLREAIERYKDVAVIKAVEALKAQVKAALEGGK